MRKIFLISSTFLSIVSCSNREDEVKPCDCEKITERRTVYYWEIRPEKVIKSASPWETFGTPEKVDFNCNSSESKFSIDTNQPYIKYGFQDWRQNQYQYTIRCK